MLPVGIKVSRDRGGSGLLTTLAIIRNDSTFYGVGVGLEMSGFSTDFDNY